MSWEWFSAEDELPEPPVDLVAVLLDRPAWQRDGLCQEPAYSHVDFFPLSGSAAAAQEVCGRCLARVECLDYALERGERFGVWGGTTARARKALRQAQTAA